MFTHEELNTIFESRNQKPNPAWAFQVDTVDRWAYQDNVFTDEECDSIIAHGKWFNLEDGTVSLDSGGFGMKDVRESKIVFLQPTEDFSWVYRRLTDVVTYMNQQYFNFDVFGFTESLQFTEYNAPTGKYGAHVDKIPFEAVRKLSIVVQLTDPSTYEGGDFKILDGGTEGEALSRKRGTILAFPSYTLHEVTPVTKGTRHSLVGWISGKPFK